MYCPFCHFEETKVIDSRLVVTGDQIRRRRECLSCNERFTTFEVVELSWPRIIKRDGTRSQFDENKLRIGILKSLEKRAVATDAIEAAIHRILSRLRAVAEREVQSALIGEWVMEELLLLDEVAYVRFASVYKSFEDLEAFRKEIQQLKRREG